MHLWYYFSQSFSFSVSAKKGSFLLQSSEPLQLIVSLNIFYVSLSACYWLYTYALYNVGYKFHNQLNLNYVTLIHFFFYFIVILRVEFGLVMLKRVKKPIKWLMVRPGGPGIATGARHCPTVFTLFKPFTNNRSIKV